MYIDSGTKRKSDPYGDYAKKRAEDEKKAKELYGSDYTTGYTSGGGGGATYSPSPKPNPNTGMNIGGGAGAGTGSNQGYNKRPVYDYNPYAEYMDAINQQRREEEEARRRAIDAGVGQLQSQIPRLEQQRDDASRQAYIRAQQEQANMPQQLAAMGATGGLSETAMMQSNAGYQNTQNEVANAYRDALTGVNGDIANLRANGDLSIVENSGKYYQQLLDVARQQAEESASKKYTSSDTQTGGGASGKPADAYGFKSNDEYVKALRSNTVKNWLKILGDNEQRNPPANEQIKNSERYYALKSAYNQGMFTDAEFSAIAKNWGIPV